MKQIILAAGYATRLYPLTERTPKPLLPVAGEPMIEHVLASSAAIGHIDRTLVVTNNKFAGHFQEWLAGYQETHPDFNGAIVNDGTTSNEDRLGAIGDLQLVLEQEAIDDDVLVIAGDLFGATPSAPATPTPSAPAIQQQQQPYPQYSAQAQSGTNGMAIAGMIMGILSLVTICCYGFPFTLLGIIFSAIGLSQIKKSNPRQSGKGMAIAGLICSILSFLIYAAILIVVIASEM